MTKENLTGAWSQGGWIADTRIVTQLLEALWRIGASPVHDNGMHDGTGQTVAEVVKAAVALAKPTGKKT